MHNHTTKFTHGDIVYLITDKDQLQRMVVSISIKPDGGIVYELACAECCSFHYEMEMSASENKALKMGLASNITNNL